MREVMLIFLLACSVAVLLGVVLYQQYRFHRGTGAALEKMSGELADILDTESGRQLMVFTDEAAIMKLSGQINRLILERERMKVNFKRQEMSSKKMLANISHDIKTPLTVISGYLEMMRREHPDDEALAKVEAKARQVVELVNEFFTLAKLESGDLELEVGKVNVSELCREHVLGFYELLLEKEFEVEVVIPECDLFAWGDGQAFGRILDNLLSNVMRYGGDGSYLGVFLREKDGFVCVDVADKGKGIEKEFAASVFERLYTMEDSRNREIQGNGLGLTIAKNLAEQMGGALSLESEPGERTVFTVRLKSFGGI